MQTFKKKNLKNINLCYNNLHLWKLYTMDMDVIFITISHSKIFVHWHNEISQNYSQDYSLKKQALTYK